MTRYLTFPTLFGFLLALGMGVATVYLYENAVERETDYLVRTFTEQSRRNVARFENNMDNVKNSLETVHFLDRGVERIFPEVNKLEFLRNLMVRSTRDQDYVKGAIYLTPHEYGGARSLKTTTIQSLGSLPPKDPLTKPLYGFSLTNQPVNYLFQEENRGRLRLIARQAIRTEEKRSMFIRDADGALTSRFLMLQATEKEYNSAGINSGTPGDDTYRLSGLVVDLKQCIREAGDNFERENLRLLVRGLSPEGTLSFQFPGGQEESSENDIPSLPGIGPYQSNINLGGISTNLQFYPLPAYRDQNSPMDPLLTLGLGAGVTILLLLYCFGTAYRVGKIYSLVDEKKQVIERQKEVEKLLKKKAHYDELTDLPNRRYFLERLKEEITRARRYGHFLSVVMIDLDYFKFVNDNHGHATGDRVLEKFAKILSDSSRSVDIPGRFGGEEFSIALPETDIEGAENIAERVRCLVEEESFEVEEGYEAQIHLTCSLGVATLRPEEDVDNIIQRADDAMYRAKKQGRNRVVVDRPEELSTNSPDNHEDV